MKKIHPILILILLISLTSSAQFPVTQIEGFLEVSHQSDSTSIYIGKGRSRMIDASQTHSNTLVGIVFGDSTTTGSSNSFFGASTGNFNTSGKSNSFFGGSAGRSNTTGSWNSFFGDFAGNLNTTGNYNSFFGRTSGDANNSGSYNSFFGQKAGGGNREGESNSFFGASSGSLNKMGSRNSFFGRASGTNIKGDNNIAIGYTAGPKFLNGQVSERLYIDVQESNDPLIYGEFDNNLVRINGELQLGPNTFAGGVGGDEGIIKSPRSSGSDIFVISNDGIQMRIGEVDAEEGTFEIFNGAANDRIFFLREDGYTEIDGNLDVTGTINGSSDVNRKNNFQTINTADVLSKVSNLEITKWQYKATDQFHIGPMAQDFYAAFGLGQGETTIATVDADGVALAAIQALNEKLEWEKHRNNELEKEVQDLKKKMERIEKMLLQNREISFPKE